MSKTLSKIKSALLCEREIICISKNGINSRKVGTIFLVWNLLLVLWTSFATVKYFDLRVKMAVKDNKIVELKLSRQKLLSNFVILEKDIKNVKKFIVSLNNYDRFKTVDGKNALFNDTSNIDVDNARIVLDRAKDDMKSINLALIDRINGLEDIKGQLRVNGNIQRVSYEQSANVDVENVDKDVADSIVLNKTLKGNLEYLQNLESFLNDVPLYEPIETNLVNSTFGKRLHPILKVVKEHHGVDLVGSYMAKIYAPARGVVAFAGVKPGYGKVVILEHKNNIRTVYAHLNSYSVAVGEKVERGENIGVQGNTGRSTGQHLHYEILQGNYRYNPMNFIRVGENLH